MSYALGIKIKQLRTDFDITQEEMAQRLNTSRQRYARIESGQIDISFAMIKKIADILGVNYKEITCAEEENRELVTFFREKENFDSSQLLESVKKIEQILKVFHSHEKLYYQMKERGQVEN